MEIRWRSRIFYAATLSLIPILFAILQVPFLKRDIWWDASVYTEMGKFLYSFGKSGFLEPSRPLVWPAILGLPWRLGLDYILAGKILSIISGALCIIFTFLIAKELKGIRTGILPSIFLMLMPTFFLSAGLMLSELPSTLFMLASFYFFIKGKYFASGLLAGVSFLARFFQIFIFAGMVISIALMKKPRIRIYARISAGFAIMLIPYMIFSYLHYGGILVPFKEQIFMTQNTGWMHYSPYSFYLAMLLAEFPAFILAAIGIYFLMSKRDDYRNLALLCAFIVPFVLLSTAKHKEMRLLIMLMPYLSIISSIGFYFVLERLQNRLTRGAVFIFILLSLAVSANAIASEYELIKAQSLNDLSNLQQYLNNNPEGNIWISNPEYALYSDAKISGLIYYPTFDSAHQKILIKNLDKAHHILINTCDIPCRADENYAACETAKNELMDAMKKELKMYYNKINTANGCGEFIFVKN